MSNKIKDIIDIIFSGTTQDVQKLKDELETSKQEFDALTSTNNELKAEIITDETEIKNIKKETDNLSQQDITQANFWNNKWPRSPITFQAQDGVPLDIRNFILEKSYILQSVANSYKDIAFDQRALQILNDVVHRITYVGDDITHHQNDYWQNPEETWQTQKGDCEDGALLLATLLLLSGVPNYRIKLCCGNVLANNAVAGHCYCIYLADDNTWRILDWCYWPQNSIDNYKNNTHNNQPEKYKDIWFTFNNQYTWSEHEITISK